MNKYITALLVVLATTGVEAQTYQSVLKAALGDTAIESPYHYQAFKDLEDNIANILKAINEEKEENKVEPTHAKHFIYQVDTPLFKITKDRFSLNILKDKFVLPNPSTHACIFIRGPNT